MAVYDSSLSPLMEERNLKRFTLDNACLYEPHFRMQFPECDDVELWVPTWHALGHGYVRACACCASSLVIDRPRASALPGEEVHALPALERIA